MKERVVRCVHKCKLTLCSSVPKDAMEHAQANGLHCRFFICDFKKILQGPVTEHNQSYHLDQTEHHLNFTEFTADQVQPLIITIYAFFRWMLPAA